MSVQPMRVRTFLVYGAAPKHGIVALRPGSGAALPDLAVGARLRILPNHACATGAQHDRYHVISGGALTGQVWPRINGW